jgi:hypothetical protein
MPRRTIERVPASIPVAEFNERFLSKETPVILEGVEIDPTLPGRVTAPGLLDAIEAREEQDGQRKAVRHSTFWLDITPEGAKHDAAMAALYQDLRRLVPNEGVNLRETHVRLWGSPQGTVTSWHYDGNGVHGLNLQVTGRKFWQIVSPETPMPTYPFVFYLVQGSQPLNARQREELDWMGFETKPGDLLFLPRLWSHLVISLEPWNLNLNLVFTPKSVAHSAMANRELGRVASLAMIQRSPLWRLLPEVIRDGVVDGKGYGGDEEFFVKRTPPSEVARSVLRELRTMPIAGLVLHYRRAFGLE